MPKRFLSRRCVLTGAAGLSAAAILPRSSLANYGLKDGMIFDFISRTTPTSGQEINYVAPLFKALNIGQGSN